MNGNKNKNLSKISLITGILPSVIFCTILVVMILIVTLSVRIDTGFSGPDLGMWIFLIILATMIILPCISIATGIKAMRRNEPNKVMAIVGISFSAITLATITIIAIIVLSIPWSKIG